MKKSIHIILLILPVLVSQGQTVSMDFSRTDCGGTEHNLYQELNQGKVVVLEYIMLGCASCIIATEHVSGIVASYEATHPGRIRHYNFGFIKNYNCDQLDAWKQENHLGGTMFEDGSSQVGYYGGMGMPTVVITATDNHTILYKKLGFEPSDTVQIKAAIQTGLQYNPQGVGDNDGTAQLRIWPTIFTNSLNVGLARLSSGSISLYDIAGKEVICRAFTGTDRLTLDDLSLTAGIYFIVVRTADGPVGTGKAIRK